MEKENWFDKLLMKKYFYILITLAFIGTFTYVFAWQHFCYWFDEKYVVNNELLGTYGDFIGGVLGTIFSLISILILIRTFNQQRAVTEKSKEQIDNQRFNDIFFELLKLYQSEVSELCGQIEKKNRDGVDIYNYNNKDFFDFEKELLQGEFKPKDSFEENLQEASKFYMHFYVEHRTKIAACFRTLYRIYDLLDNSGINESIKKNYLKILRAQLTDSELFFIRYNAMSYFGTKFINYINKYNILKHLSIFDLLEFKNWRENLTQIECMGINIIFNQLRKELSQKETPHKSQTSNESKYNFETQIKNNFEVNLIFRINYSKKNNFIEYDAFEKFNRNSIEDLLTSFLKEVYIYSNFSQINKQKDIEISSNLMEINQDIYIINFQIKNTQKKALSFKYE